MRYLCLKNCTTSFGEGEKPPVFCEAGKFYDFGEIPTSDYLVSTEPVDPEAAAEAELEAAKAAFEEAQKKVEKFGKKKTPAKKDASTTE